MSKIVSNRRLLCRQSPVLDRVFRPKDISTFGDVFKPIIALEANKRLFCDLGELNLNDPNDNLKLTIWGGMAGFERYKIKERTSRGNKMKALLPDTCTRKLPEGVVFKRFNDRVNAGVFGFNEYARTVIAPAFKRAAAGDRLMQIVTDMITQAKEQFGLKIGYTNGYGNSGKYKSGFGRAGTKSLRDTLQSRWWLCEKPGNVPANFATWKDEENGLMTSEPIIDEALWVRVQDRLKRNTDSDNWSKLKPIKPDFLVAGLMFCGKCGSKMYHKYKKDGRTGKRYPIYECSNRYRGLGCKMPRVAAFGTGTILPVYNWLRDSEDGPVGLDFNGDETPPDMPIAVAYNGTFGTDEILASTLEYKLTHEPEIIAAAIQETIDANQSTENKAKLVVEERAVRDLERKVANFTDALGEAESKEVRQSISKKLEEVGMQLATVRTTTSMLSKEMKAAVDPKKAAEHVQAVFADSRNWRRPNNGCSWKNTLPRSSTTSRNISLWPRRPGAIIPASK